MIIERFKQFMVRPGVDLLSRDPNIKNDTTDQVGGFALIIARDTGRVLLGKRGKKENDPGLWSNFGGHADTEERITDAIRREVFEETGYRGPMDLIQLPLGKFKENEFQAYNFIGIISNEFKPKAVPEFAFEVEKFKWFDFNNLPEPLHPKLRKAIKRSLLLIKTVINIVN